MTLVESAHHYLFTYTTKHVQLALYYSLIVDLLDIIERVSQRVVNINTHNLPISFSPIKQGNSSQYLHLFYLSNIPDIPTNLLQNIKSLFTTWPTQN